MLNAALLPGEKNNLMNPNNLGFDEEFIYLTKSDYRLMLHSDRLDNFWEYLKLNKALLVSLNKIEGYADEQSELQHSKKNGFGLFKKRRL